MNEYFNVRDGGCTGNGQSDDTAALQSAIDAHARIRIPEGTYRISETLHLHSGTHIEAAPDARIIYIASRPMNIHDFLLSNDDTMFGNQDISIEGGVWDGGNQYPYNVKRHDLFTIGGPSGACLNFVGVKNLSLRGLEISNTIAFYIRMSRLKDFEIRDITFSGEKLTTNQDGLHFGGMVYNGVIENIRSVSWGQTGDDMLAFNADDSVQRHDNRGLNCGPIENIRVRGVYAEHCMCAIRFASISAPIRNIHISDLNCGCWGRGINADALRYCRTPLILEESAPGGVGCLENITLENCSMHFTVKSNEPLICLESHADQFRIRNFSRPENLDQSPESPSFTARHLVRQRVTADGKEAGVLSDKSQVCSVDRFTDLDLDYSAPEA